MPLLAPPRMGRGAQRFAFACASTSQEPSRSSSEHSPPPRSVYALLRLYRSRVSSALSDFSWAVRGDCRSSRTIAPLTLRDLLPTGMYGASHSLARGCVLTRPASRSVSPACAPPPAPPLPPRAQARIPEYIVLRP